MADRERERPPSWKAWRAAHTSYWRYLLAVEWCLEWIAYWLGRWAFIEVLEYAGKFTVLVVVILWVLAGDDRRKERHYRAWALIAAAAGNTGDLGRKAALKDLNNDGVNRAGIAGGCLV